MQLDLTAAQLAKLANIPKGSLGFYVASGLLQPSVRRANRKGQPNIFGFQDLVIAVSIAQMRLPSISIAPMRGIAEFWRSSAGATLLNSISSEVLKDGNRRTSVEKVFVLLANGQMVTEENLPILDLTRKHRSPVVHVIDVGQLVESITVDTTEALMRLELVPPGPGGRVPREKKTEPTEARHAARCELAKRKTPVSETPMRDAAKKNAKNKKRKK